jgi:hypothetical protein
VRDRDTWSWWHQGQVDIETKHYQDKQKMLTNCAKKKHPDGSLKYPKHRGNPFIQRLEDDEEFLTQMVLRDTLSETPELLNPWIQQQAIRVAQRLGKYVAIMDLYHRTVRGANAEDTCPIVLAEMPKPVTLAEMPIGPLWFWFVSAIVMLLMFLLGCMCGWLLKRSSGRKAPSTRNISTQSQTTYTSLRGCTVPRFHPLPEMAHGASVE